LPLPVDLSLPRSILNPEVSLSSLNRKLLEDEQRRRLVAIGGEIKRERGG